MDETISESNINSEIDSKNTRTNDVNFRLKAGIFLTTVTGLSAAIAFATTLASAKRKDPKFFDKGVSVHRNLEESGVHLALRALKWGTFYAVSGCGLVCYGIWKLSGATNMEEFRHRMGAVLPKIRKNDPPQGRTEFAGLTDLLKYISEDYVKDVPKTGSS